MEAKEIAREVDQLMDRQLTEGVTMERCEKIRALSEKYKTMRRAETQRAFVQAGWL